MRFFTAVFSSKEQTWPSVAYPKFISMHSAYSPYSIHGIIVLQDRAKLAFIPATFGEHYTISKCLCVELFQCLIVWEGVSQRLNGGGEWNNDQDTVMKQPIFYTAFCKI